jgi:hypothetical protein
MRKKVNIDVEQRRRRSDFMARVGDIFDRKFDGFPASVPNPQNRPSNGFVPNPTLIVDDEGMEAVDDVSPCEEEGDGSDQSGTYTRQLFSDDDGATYEFPLVIDYVISVWKDGVLQRINLDYAVVSNFLTPQTPWGDARVVARFVV